MCEIENFDCPYRKNKKCTKYGIGCSTPYFLKMIEKQGIELTSEWMEE